MEPIAKFRENIFAVRSMNVISAMANENRQLGDGALYFSLQHSWYRQIVNSLAWELEIPFMCCFALERLKDFPLRRVKDFKENLRATLRGVGSIDHAIQQLEDVQAFALIDNDKIRDIIAASMNVDGEFANVNAQEHVSATMSEVLEKLPKKGPSLGWNLLELKIADYNSAVWDLTAPLEDSIQNLVIESWENHAWHLAAAMATFDFKKNRVQVNKYLAFENVPESVSDAYLYSFSDFGKRAHELAGELKEVNEKILDIVSDGQIEQTVVARRKRYQNLQQSFQNFAERSQGSAESILCICDCSPAGFLNN